MKQDRTETKKENDRIEEIILLLNQGYCLFEIALYYQTTETKLKNKLYILKKHGDIAEDIYQFIQEKDKNLKKNTWLDIFTRLELLEKEGIDFQPFLHNAVWIRYMKYKQGRDVIREFAINKKDFAEIAAEFHRSKSFIREMVNNEEYLELFSIEQRMMIKQKIIERQEELHLRFQQQQQQFNDFLFNKQNGILNIKLHQLELNKSYFFKLIMTFRLTIEDFSELIGIDFTKRELYYLLMKIMGNSFMQNALHYVFECYAIYYPDLEKRRLKEAQAFDKKLKLAQLMKDQTAIQQLLTFLNDSDFQAVSKKMRQNEKLTEEEWAVVFHYRFKYAVSYRKMQLNKYSVLHHMPKKYEEENKILNQFLRESGIHRRNYSENLAKKKIKNYYQ